MKSFAIILLLFSLFALANENESEQLQDQAQVEQHRQEYQEQLDELEKKFPGFIRELKTKIQNGNILEVQKMIMEKLTKDAPKGKKYEYLMKKLTLRFSRFSHEEVKMTLRQKTQNQYAQKIFTEIPFVLDFMAHLYRDSEALPKLGSILDQKRKLYILLGFNVALFFIFWGIKVFSRNKNAPSSSNFLKSLFMSFTKLAIRLGSVVFLFGRELYPLVDVVKRSL